MTWKGRGVGQVNSIRHARRKYLVKSGKASFWCPAWSLDDALKKAGLDVGLENS